MRRYEQCWVIYDDMIHDGVSMNVISYNMMLDVAARHHKMNRVPYILNRMLSDAQKPPLKISSITLSNLIKGYCLQGDVLTGFMILEFVRNESNFDVDESMYHHLLE